MSYKALLFCPEEKTARVLTQVLSELEFQVEACNEPFAAVKKLMAEHFDAVVVDCENEQNASLLFKSARNSGSNETSLAVAVVEGQSGVAKAFRIGANLVLTKPINVEQSKGTLRVARGLLRKTEASKAAGPHPAMETPPPPAAPTLASKTAFPSSSGPQATPAFTPGPPAPAAPIPVVSASSQFELEAEPEPKPEPTEAALLESMPDPLGDKTHGATAFNPPAAGKQSPWQPVSKTMAEPMASALQYAAEAAGKPAADSEAAKNKSLAGISAIPTNRLIVASAQGAAAAPAAAKETPWQAAAAVSTEIEPPSFATSLGEPSASGNKKIIVIAAIVLAAAAVGFFHWRKIIPSLSFLHKPAAHSPAVTSNPAITPPSPVPTVLAPPYSAEVTATPLPAVPDMATTSAPTATVPTAAPTPVAPSTKKSNHVAKVAAESPSPVKTVTDESPTDALVVKGDAPKPVLHTPPPQDAAEASAPEAMTVASGSADPAVSGLLSLPAAVPQVGPQTLKVSQGVSQGLLVKKVPPVYPPHALQMRVEGTVQLVAHISRAGDITDIKVLSGDALLAQAAVDAVKQWKYKPYYLDSQPVEIQTQITVNFKLP